MKRFLSAVALLALALPAWAQVKVTGVGVDKPVPPCGYADVQITAPEGSAATPFMNPPPDQFKYDKGRLTFAVIGGRTYFVPVIVTNWDKKTQGVEVFTVTTVAGKNCGETPEPPLPPGPGPKPPEPVPPDQQPLIPGDGFRAMFVYETGDLSRYPSAIVSAMSSQKVYDYLRAKSAKGPDGKPDVRNFDADVVATVEPWQTGLKNAKERLKGKPFPWLVATNGKQGYADSVASFDVNKVMEKLEVLGGK